MQRSKRGGGHFVQACRILALLVLPILLAINVTALTCFGGCEHNGKCISIGEQRLTQEGGYKVYCAAEDDLRNAKEDDEGCTDSYECISYICEDGTCGRAMVEDGGSSFVVIVFIIVVLLIVFSGFFLVKGGYIKLKKEEKKPKKKPGFVPPHIAAYKTKTGPQKFEEQIKTLKGKKKN